MRAQRLARAGRLYEASLEPLPPQEGEVVSQTVCGTNGMVTTNLIPHCRITVFWQNNVVTTCSASKINANRLATAGHCVYNAARVRRHASNHCCWVAAQVPAEMPLISA